MSLDLELERSTRHEQHDRPKPARCTFPECNSPDFEIPVPCESCNAFTCEKHRKEYELYALCRTCEAKERAHINVTVLALLSVVFDAYAGKASANSAAERLYFIADKLEKWDFPKAEAKAI